jgi:hypothetical protein
MHDTKIINYRGQPLEVEVITPAAQREPFKAKFVQVPLWWVEMLQHRSGSTYHLALKILDEAFKRKHIGGEVILSSEMTGMSREMRRRAIRELVQLALIEIEQDGNRAIRVSYIYYQKKKKKKEIEEGPGG